MGIFLSSRGIINRVALENDIKPAGWEEVEVHPFPYFSLSLNAAGKIAFVARARKERLKLGRAYTPRTSPLTSDTIFLGSSGTLKQVATTGDPSPTGSEFLGVLPQQVFLNSKDQVLFAASIGAPTLQSRDQDGLFLSSRDIITKIIVLGDASPLGGTFSQLRGGIGGGMEIPFSFSLNDHGHVAFVGLVEGGTAPEGVFVASYGVIRKVMAVGYPFPTLGYFKAFAFPALNDVGDVAFFASGEDLAQGGIFTFSRTMLTKVVVTGDPTPIGGQFDDVYSKPALNNSGEVVFGAQISDGRKGIFLSSGGVIQKVVAAGDPTPSGGSFTFRSIMGPAYDFPPWEYCLDDAGRVAFHAEQGLFLASPIE